MHMWLLSLLTMINILATSKQPIETFGMHEEKVFMQNSWHTTNYIILLVQVLHASDSTLKPCKINKSYALHERTHQLINITQILMWNAQGKNGTYLEDVVSFKRPLLINSHTLCSSLYQCCAWTWFRTYTPYKCKCYNEIHWHTWSTTSCTQKNEANKITNLQPCLPVNPCICLVEKGASIAMLMNLQHNQPRWLESNSILRHSRHLKLVGKSYFTTLDWLKSGYLQWTPCLQQNIGDEKN